MIWDYLGLMVWVGGGIMAVGALVVMLALVAMVVALATGHIPEPFE